MELQFPLKLFFWAPNSSLVCPWLGKVCLLHWTNHSCRSLMRGWWWQIQHVVQGSCVSHMAWAAGSERCKTLWQEYGSQSSPGRQILIINSNIEQRQKIIQFNIQFKIKFYIFIQRIYSFNKKKLFKIRGKSTIRLDSNDINQIGLGLYNILKLGPSFLLSLLIDTV